MQTRAAGSWNDRVGIAVKPLLCAEIRGGRVDPDEGVFVVGYSLELVGLHLLVTLNDGFAINIHRYDSSIRTWLHIFLPSMDWICAPVQAFIPPSTVRFAPVMYDDSGPATNATIAAISSTLP